MMGPTAYGINRSLDLDVLALTRLVGSRSDNLQRLLVLSQCMLWIKLQSLSYDAAEDETSHSPIIRMHRFVIGRQYSATANRISS